MAFAPPTNSLSLMTMSERASYAARLKSRDFLPPQFHRGFERSCESDTPPVSGQFLSVSFVYNSLNCRSFSRCSGSSHIPIVINTKPHQRLSVVCLIQINTEVSSGPDHVQESIVATNCSSCTFAVFEDREIVCLARTSGRIPGKSKLLQAISAYRTSKSRHVCLPSALECQRQFHQHSSSVSRFWRISGSLFN